MQQSDYVEVGMPNAQLARIVQFGFAPSDIGALRKGRVVITPLLGPDKIGSIDVSVAKSNAVGARALMYLVLAANQTADASPQVARGDVVLLRNAMLECVDGSIGGTLVIDEQHLHFVVTPDAPVAI